MFKQESKTFKLTFMASSTWRKIFLIKYNDLHQKKKKLYLIEVRQYLQPSLDTEFEYMLGRN